MKKISPLFFLFLLLLATSCSTVPNTALEAARAKIREAEEKEANLYVADVYNAALDSIAAAETEINTQQANSPWSRDYAYAERLIRSATDLAEQSIMTLDQAREDMENETAANLIDAESAIATLNTLILRASSAGNRPVAVVSYQESSSQLSAQLDEAAQAFEIGDIFTAHQLVNKVLEQTNALIEELHTANQPSNPAQGS